MTVTYSPPLMEQIKQRHVAEAVSASVPVVVFMAASQSFVKAVDPRTRQATEDRQQFAREGERLRILPRWKWVETPHTLEVAEARF